MPNLTDIPGIPEIGTRTKGDPRITIAILDEPIWEKGTSCAAPIVTGISA